SAIAHYCVAVHLHEPFGLTDATPLVQVSQDRDGLSRGDVGAVQGGPLAFGEPRLAGAAPQEAILPPGPVVAVPGERGPAPDAVVGAVRVQAAETGEVVHGCGNPSVSGPA